MAASSLRRVIPEGVFINVKWTERTAEQAFLSALQGSESAIKNLLDR